MLTGLTLPLLFLVSLTDFTHASDHQHLPHLHKRQTDLIYGTCYISNDVRKGSQAITKLLVPIVVVCGPVVSSTTLISSTSMNSTRTSSSTVQTSTSKAATNSTTISSSSSSTSSVSNTKMISSSILTSSSSSSNSASTSTQSSIVSTTISSSIPIPTPIVPSIIGNILVSLSSNGTAIGNVSTCPQTDFSGQTYYYYSNDSSQAIQFHFTPSLDPTIPVSILFSTSIQPGYSYFGIEDNNSGTFGPDNTGSGTLAAITQGNGPDMYDTSNSFDGATNSSQASIWTFLNGGFVMSGQFFNGAVGTANSVNVSFTAYDSSGTGSSGYSYLTATGEFAYIPGGYGVYFTFVPTV